MFLKSFLVFFFLLHFPVKVLDTAFKIVLCNMLRDKMTKCWNAKMPRPCFWKTPLFMFLRFQRIALDVSYGFWPNRSMFLIVMFLIKKACRAPTRLIRNPIGCLTNIPNPIDLIQISRVCGFNPNQLSTVLAVAGAHPCGLKTIGLQCFPIFVRHTGQIST